MSMMSISKARPMCFHLNFNDRLNNNIRQVQEEGSITNYEPRAVAVSVIGNMTDRNLLLQKLEISQKNIEFLQTEHARTLTDLHNEVKFLKDKCKSLEFSVEVADILTIDEDRYLTRINALEAEVSHWCQECKRLQDHLQYAEDVVSNLENVLAKQYQQSELEISSRDDKISSLQNEISQKNRTLSYLMAELQQHRRSEKADFLSKSLIASRNGSIPSPTESAQLRRSLDETLNNSSPNPHSFSESQFRKLQSSLEKDRKARTLSMLESTIDKKVSGNGSSKDYRHSSVTHLPPLKLPHRRTSSPSIKKSSSNQRSYVRQQLRLTEPEVNIETLAIDHPIKSEPPMQSADQL